MIKTTSVMEDEAIGQQHGQERGGGLRCAAEVPNLGHAPSPF
ncbi:MAG: hypothetical protein AB1796_13450 [Bacillota bacterium]